MSSRELNFGQRISVEVLWVVCRLFSMIPFCVHYWVIAPVVYFFVYRVFRYRIDVVEENLNLVFSDKSQKERDEIKRNFYGTLSELFVGTIALASPKIGDKFDDPLDEQSDAAKFRKEVDGRNWIGLSAHFGLWEHFIFWGDFSQTYSVGAYHKLKNPVVDELFKRIRTRNHKYAVVVESRQVIRFCLRSGELRNGRNYALGLIADQNAKIYSDSKWIKFLGQDTVFFDGGEKLALKLKYPVYFVYQKRIGRGKYRFMADLIYDGEESVEPHEITRRYARRLEEEILKNPHLWLWSHRRWKKRKPNNAE